MIPTPADDRHEPRPPGDGLADREARYRELLDAERHQWPSQRLFEHYRRHYHSEIARGAFILDTLHRHAPGFEPRGARVLDIGCGDAGVPIAFAARGANAVGMEPAFRNLRRARVRADDHGVQPGLVDGVAERLPFRDHAFDLVILDNVLEHVQDQAATLAEIWRVLAPEKYLYMVTPKPFALLSLLSDPHYATPGLVLLPGGWQRKIVERRAGPDAYDVTRIPTRRWLSRALRRHGFAPLVPPRELWVRYVQDRISRPEEVRAGARRALAAWLAARPGLFEAGPVRWLLDVGLGSNFFLARRRG